MQLTTNFDYFKTTNQVSCNLSISLDTFFRQTLIYTSNGGWISIMITPVKKTNINAAIVNSRIYTLIFLFQKTIYIYSQIMQNLLSIAIRPIWYVLVICILILILFNSWGLFVEIHCNVSQ